VFGSIGDFILIVIGFGVLIFVHELGHFLAAKWAGIRAEAFAIGFGPVLLGWRKGIGARVGSTMPEYQRRAHKQLIDQNVKPKGKSDKGEPAYTEEQMLAAADELDLGETEYSLRILPLGGFVKMLGQEDANPNKTSADPRSYNMCPVGKRMIVVSAGVIMNLLFAALLYVIAFTAGVQFPAPVIGNVGQSMPAGLAVPRNAEQLNIEQPGLHAGDRVLAINGDTVNTFADIEIAAAMSRSDRPPTLTVERPGADEPLLFEITPKPSNATGLLAIGVTPASSTTLYADDSMMEDVSLMLDHSALGPAGVQPGMTMRSAAGEAIDTFQQFEEIVNRLDGEPVPTTWIKLDKQGESVGDVIEVAIPSSIELQVLYAPTHRKNSLFDFERGLFGLVPLTKISSIADDSLNTGTLQAGDVILRIGEIEGPANGVLRKYVQDRPGETIRMEVLRDGTSMEVYPEVSRSGRIGVMLAPALDVPVTAEPFDAVRKLSGSADEEPIVVDSPIASAQLMPRTTIEQVNGTPVSSWREIRAAFRNATHQAFATEQGADVPMTVLLPTPNAQPETVTVELSVEDVRELHRLGWESSISAAMFEPLHTVRSAGGNPITAIAMGIEETHKSMTQVYLTIDRLVRGTVGVEQLRGPVGIVDIGTKVADKGFIFLLYFLAIISVNLAVINFLPLPIVDGGLFLFLIYEKFKGKPPSVQFQNWATIAGLFLIGTAFLVVTWNDVMRLIQ